MVLCQGLLLQSSHVDQVCVDKSSHLQDWNHVLEDSAISASVDMRARSKKEKSSLSSLKV